MSLLYWLPMLGTLENQGLSAAQPVNHGATVGTSGKLGKCYDFSGTAQYIDTGFKESFGTGDFSISVWFKLTDSGSRTYQPIISNKTTGAASVGCAIYYNHSQQKFLWSTADGSGATEVWMAQTYSYSGMLNTWHHIVMVRNSSDAKKGYFYIDGVRYELASVPAIRNVTNTTYNLQIGDIGSHNNANYLWTGSLCDLRIYDTALSPREIKEISKGLVLHYPLNREGFGADNLYTGSMDFSGTWVNQSSWLTDSELFNGFTVKKKSSVWGGLAQNVPCANGDVFTISFYAKVDLGGNIQSIHRSSLGNVTTGLTILGGNFQSGTVWVLSSDDGTSWKYYWATVQITSSDITYLQWRIENSIADKCLYVCGMKLEVGNKATPWIPHKTDKLYSKMGLNICNENLLSKSSLNPSNWRHIYPSCTSYTGDGYDNMFEMVTTASYENVFLPVAVTSGQQYTLSVTYQVLDSFSLWQSSRPFSFQVLSAVPTNSDTFNNVLGSILVGNTAMSAPQRGSTTFTPTGDTIWLNIPGSYYKDGADSYNKRVKFSHFKLEKGATATPWVSAASDQEKFGNIVYDTSGYKYNGTVVDGGISYSSDTVRYNVSAEFDGVNSAIAIPWSVFYKQGDVFTLNLWWKKSSLGSKNYETLFGGSGIEMDTRAGGASTLSLYMASTRGGNLYTPFSFNEWYMNTLVNDGTNELYYVNGQLVKTIEKKNMPTGTCYIGAWTSHTSQNYKGLISDFRIYKTALSADDILELYHTPITLSNNGTLMTQGEYMEV